MQECTCLIFILSQKAADDSLDVARNMGLSQIGEPLKCLVSFSFPVKTTEKGILRERHPFGIPSAPC